MVGSMYEEIHVFFYPVLSMAETILEHGKWPNARKGFHHALKYEANGEEVTITGLISKGPGINIELNAEESYG